MWFTSRVLEKPLRFDYLLSVIFLGSLFGIATWLRIKKFQGTSDGELFVHLTVDAALLISLVALSGGATNPFIYYYLVLVGISAAIFKMGLAWTYCGIAITSYSILMYTDISGHAHHGFSDFQLHLVGMWFNFVGSATLLTAFVSKLANALKDREAQLSKSKEENLKNEQLIGIATLAASTAHNLGSPLSTMAIIIEELELSDTTQDQDQQDAIALLQQQISRCKNSISKLSLLTNSESLTKTPTSIAALFEELHQHYLLLNPTIAPKFSKHQRNQQTFILSDALLLHALINLIDNATQAADTHVSIQAEIRKPQVQIVISDDGDGLLEEMQQQWGNVVFSNKKDGMGIGAFLANSTIEQHDGTVEITRTSTDKLGETRVIINLPLVRI